MTTASYAAGFVRMAARLIRAKGAAVTLRRETAAYHDPVTLETVPAATQDHPARAVFVAPGATHTVRTGTLERRADWRVLVAGSGVPFTLSTNDRIVDANGLRYTVANVQQVAPEGTVILYDVLVTR